MQVREMVERLSQLRYLKAEVDELSQRIAELELMAQGGSGRISGMPRGGRRSDRVARAAACMADLREKMEDRRLDCMEELGRLYDFIDGVEESQMRLILSARYIDGMSWQQVAWKIGETDEQVPRRLHNRLIEKKLTENGKFDENDERKVL